MVPVVASPLRWPFTFHTTLVSLTLLTTTVNCWVPSPACRLTDPGVRLMMGNCGADAPHPHTPRARLRIRVTPHQSFPLRSITGLLMRSLGPRLAQQIGQTVPFVDGVGGLVNGHQVIGHGHGFEQHRPAGMAAALQSPGG